MRIPRGVVVASFGIVALVVGSAMFDGSYNVVESVMLHKQYLIEDKVLPQGEEVNSTIPWDSLYEHTILIVRAQPTSSQVKLSVGEPGGSSFEKASKDGYAYHIIGKSSQHQGAYSFEVSNTGTGPATLSVILGEDPYLSGKCQQEDQYSCYAIPAAIGIVIGGMLALVIGSIVAINDFRKKKPQPKS